MAPAQRTEEGTLTEATGAIVAELKMSRMVPKGSHVRRENPEFAAWGKSGKAAPMSGR